jgi:hypothetical protein
MIQRIKVPGHTSVLMRTALNQIPGTNTTWVALIDFYCGDNERDRLHCVTVIVNDPTTSGHRFMKPDEVVQATGGDAI